MSTLVKYLLALVLQITGGEPPQDPISWNPQIETCTEYRLEQLNPHYIISRDEILSLQNSVGI